MLRISFLIHLGIYYFFPFLISLLKPLTIGNFFWPMTPPLGSSSSPPPPPPPPPPPLSTYQKKTPTSENDPHVNTHLFFHRQLPPCANARKHANFLETPFSHQGRPTPTSFPSPLVPLFGACICSFFLSFMSDNCTFLGFLDFSDTQRNL